MKAKHIATFFAAALLAAACADTPAAPFADPGAARFEEGGNSMGSGNATGGTSDGGNSMGSGNDVSSPDGGIFVGGGHQDSPSTSTDSTTTERGGNYFGSGN